MRLIAHISDLHFGSHDPGIAEALLADIGRTGPDLVVLSGDLTQRARSGQFAQARQFIDCIQQPVLIVPGNHDIPLYNVMHRFLRPLEKFRRHVSPAAVADDWYCDDEMAVLGLNTARSLTWKSGRVSLDQMGQIRRAFSNVPARAWRLLVTHHPIAAAHGEPRIQLAGRSVLALRAISDAGVHLLLSGHHHRPVSGHAGTELLLENKVLVVHAGTAVSTRTRGGEGNSYNLIRLNVPHISIDVMGWDQTHGFRAVRSSKYSMDFRAGQLEAETR
jgi:3',5'-cyclic AMP phosphodiesterase CpdA